MEFYTCPTCGHEGRVNLTLIAPNGAPLELPGVYGWADNTWELARRIKVTIRLVCPACGAVEEVKPDAT